MKMSENYRILFDENNVILQYFDIREKNKKDGSVEEYEYQQNTFYPTVKTALLAFLSKSLHGSASVEDLISRIERVEKIILAIPAEPRQTTN